MASPQKRSLLARSLIASFNALIAFIAWLMQQTGVAIDRSVRWWISRIRGARNWKYSTAWLVGGLVTICFGLIVVTLPFRMPPEAEAEPVALVEEVAAGEAQPIEESEPAEVLEPTATSEPTSTPAPSATLSPTNTPEPTSTPEPTATPEPLVAVRTTIEEALGSSNRGVARVTTVELLGSQINVEWALNDNLTEGLFKAGARWDVQRIMQAVAQQGGPLPYDSLHVAGSMALVDQLGNVQEGRVVQARYARSTLEQINWDNFLRDNVYNVAESVELHPVMRE